MKKDLIEKTAKEVIKHFKKSKKSCVILPTGTGKTVIATLVAKGLKAKKILYLSPNNYINGQTICSFRNSGMEITVMTFAKCYSDICKGKIIDLNDFDLVVFDEIHRLGAKTYNIAWYELMKYLKVDSGTKILGLTATETRYLDDGRNMQEELFPDDLVVKKTLPDIFDEFYMKAPTYVLCADVDSVLIKCKDVLDKVTLTEELEQIRKEALEMENKWHEIGGLEGVFKKNLDMHFKDHDMKKLLVFYWDIKSTRETQEKIQKCLNYSGYDKLRFYTINSSYPEKTNDHTLDQFNLDDDFDGVKVLFSVNKLNEGLHVKNCFAEVMFRSTISRTLYLQQLGRVLSYKNETRSIVFDCVQNVFTSDLIADYISVVSRRHRIINGIEPIKYIEEQINEEQLKNQLAIVDCTFKSQETSSYLNRVTDPNYENKKETKKFLDYVICKYSEGRSDLINVANEYFSSNK